jgi:hypothetical protein
VGQHLISAATTRVDVPSLSAEYVCLVFEFGVDGERALRRHECLREEGSHRLTYQCIIRITPDIELLMYISATAAGIMSLVSILTTLAEQ